MQEGFEEALYTTVKDVLREVLGEKVTKALAFYIDVKSALKTPARFFIIMHDLVGPKQSEKLRDQVLAQLYQKFGIEYAQTGQGIAEELSLLKSKISSKG